MCANIDVDQAAALLLCSYEAARAAGVPDERMVFLHAAAEAHDHYFFSERWSLADSPGIATAVGDALAAAGITLDDIARFDLYSCFPSAVQVAMRRARPRRPTIPGRSRSPAGSASRAVRSTTTRRTRSRAMVEVLRADPERFGCTTALGWYISKHATGIWSATPPANGFRRVDPRASQAKVDALPRREPAGLVDGDGHARGDVGRRSSATARPSLGIVTALTADGRRAMANIRDTDALHGAHDRSARRPTRARSPTTAATNTARL